MPTKNTDLNRYVIWIDQKKALIGKFDAEDHFTCITHRSGLGRRTRFEGETSNKTRVGAQTRNRQSQSQEKHNQEFLQFCREVIDQVEQVSSLLILGPGEMKFLLENELTSLPRFQMVWFEAQAADKMTIPQLNEAGKKHYHILSSE